MEMLTERAAKRRRLDRHEEPGQIHIRNVDQLHDLLHFRQSVSADVRNGVNQFKDFLSAISRTENVAFKSEQLRILRQYCDAQISQSRDQLDFPDLISVWSFAVQSGNDPLCSAIPAALSQFYKTISGFLELRDFGLALGRTLLKQEQVPLIGRGLSASRSKEHLISPCLRLLTEIVQFDGGTLASRIFDRRDVLLKKFDSLLEPSAVEAENDRRKPTVRRMALRLFIANMKFQDANARVEFATHGRVLRNCLRGLPTDGDDVVVDVLTALETGLVDDHEVPRAAKIRILNPESLASLLALYGYELDTDYPNSSSNVRNAVHKVFLKVCTTRKGILVPQTGWYPTGFDGVVNSTSDNDSISLGLDSPLYSDEYVQGVPVKNSVLSAFMHSLKPDSDTLQSTLLLQIFRAAPELVASYFSQKVKFAPLSSEDPIWRGQFAFLFAAVQLTVPKNFGWQEGVPAAPPPVSVIIESIIPRPFDRSTFARFFTSDDGIINLSGARLLTEALSKLSKTLKGFSERTESEEWAQASMRLVEAVLQRVPKLQELINALQRSSHDNATLKTALFECLAAYHRILPEATAASKFDFGATLSDAITNFERYKDPAEAGSVVIEQVLHLVIVAYLSPATKWWSKPGSDTLSLFTKVLHFAVKQSKNDRTQQIMSLLSRIARQAGFLAPAASSFTALVQSVTPSKKFDPSSEVWLVLDNAACRAAQRPVKYLDRVEAIQCVVSDKRPLSLIGPAVAEQWGFAMKNYAGQKNILKAIAKWIVRLYKSLDSAGENFRVMQQLQDDLLQSSDTKSKEVLQQVIDKGLKKALPDIPVEEELVPPPESQQATSQTHPPNLNEILGTPAAPADTVEGFDRWDEKTDIEIAVQSGKVTGLFLCTASLQDETRKQAFQSLQRFAHTVDQSTYEEKAQLYLLSGELIETIRRHGLDVPLPSVVAELASRLVQIIVNPAHALYGKVNKFLLRGPAWESRKLVPYWTKTILFLEPDGDEAGAWTDQVEWLLQWLVDGLKTSADMNLYRRSGVLEKVFTLYNKPGLGRAVRRIILTLIWRSICVGDSDMLITRVGMLNWLAIAMAIDKDHTHLIRLLRDELDQTCDGDMISQWKQDRPVLRGVD